MARRVRRRARLSGWKPNRIAARFISGGKHQTFKSIAKSPFRTKTITNKANRRQQYQVARRREQRAAQAAKRKAAREATAQKRAYARRAAELKRLAPKQPRKPRPKSPPIAVNPRTGKPITWAQAVKALREAEERAERLAAGLSGDAPAKKPRVSQPARKGKPAPRRLRATQQSPIRSRRPSSPAKRPARKKVGPPPDPALAPGKNLRGLYMALTCECHGTGRIATLASDGRIVGSTSCPEHGRKARGSRKFFARRAMKNAGLPGLSGWLESRRGGNRDKQQRRAQRRSERRRHAGPTEICSACDEGIVNRELTDDLRAAHISDLIAKYQGMGRRLPSSRQLDAMARKAYPYDHCRECGGLGRVPSQHAGDWFRRTELPQRHTLTARERATGKRQK